VAAIYVIALMVLSLLQLLAVTAVTCRIDGQTRAKVGPLSEPAERYLRAIGFPRNVCGRSPAYSSAISRTVTNSVVSSPSLQWNSR